MSRPNVMSVGEALPSSQTRAASHRYTEADIYAVSKPSPVPSSPTTKSPFRGMPDRSSVFKNRTPSKLGADGEAVNGGRNGFTAVEFRSEWEDELERRTQRRRESESPREEGESPLGSDNSASPPIPPPRAPRNESESAPSSAGPVPPPRRQISNEQQRQQEAAAALEAAVQRAAEVGAADYAALEEAEGLGKSPTTKSPTPPPRLIRSAGSSGGSGDGKVIREKGTPHSSPRQEGEPDPSTARSFAGTRWVAKPGGPQRRPLHPLRPPPPPEEEEEEPPPPDPLATAMNSSKVVGNFMLSAVEGAKTLAKEVVPISPKGKYAGDGGAKRDNIFRQKARFEASVRKEAEAKLKAVMPNLMQRTTDAEGTSKLKAQIDAAKAAGVAGPVIAAAEQKLKVLVMGEENRQRAQAERLRKESEQAELISPAGIARKAAEDQLRAVYPFPGMFADPAKLKPAIEAAKEAGVAAPIVAMAEAKLKEAEESPGRLVEARGKASSALENTANALQSFQDSVANWEMPSWDEGVTVTVGDTKVRGRGLSLLAMPVAVMGLVVKNRSQTAIEEADNSLRRSRIVRAWSAERSAWVGSDTASVASSDDGEKPSNSPFLLCVRGGKHLDTARASAEEQATAAGRSARFPSPPPTPPHSPTPPPRPTLPHPPRRQVGFARARAPPPPRHGRAPC